MRRRTVLFPVLLLPFLLPLLLTGCRPGGRETASAPGQSGSPAAGTASAGSTTTGAASAPTRSRPLTVALLTPGPISDAGWNASAYEGLQLIQKTLGAKVEHQQTKSPSEFEAAFRDFARQGYDLIFAHGNEYGDAAMKVARDFPKTTFAISSGGVSAPNVTSMVFDLGQATYLCGEIAASMSKTGKIGCVGGIQLPSVKSTFISLAAGVKAVKPADKVAMVYTGSFEDQSAAKQATAALIDAGNDFIFHNADQAGLGVIETVKESKAKGVYAFGSNKDQNALAPDVILASAVLDVPQAFLTIAREVQAGHVVGGTRYLGMKEGVVSLVYNPKLESRIPPAVLTRVEKDKSAIINGALKVPHGQL